MNSGPDTSLAAAKAGGLQEAAKSGLAELSPAYFAMVMATGIVSIAAHFQGLQRLAVALLWLNDPSKADVTLTHQARARYS